MRLTPEQLEQIQQGRREWRREKPTEKQLRVIEYTQRQTRTIKQRLDEVIDAMEGVIMNEYEQAGSLTEFDEFLSNLELQFGEGGLFNQDIYDASEDIVDYLEEWHKEKFNEALARAVGIDVSGFISEYGLEEVKENAVNAVANKLEELYGFQLQRSKEIVSNALLGGVSKEEFHFQLLREVFSAAKSEKRLRSTAFYARDITQRVVNAFNRERQKAAGIKEYVWITSRDNRVRDTHAIMQGLTVNWETGIIKATPEAKKRGVAGKKVDNVAGGHPGSEYNCRCTAKAIVRF